MRGGDFQQRPYDLGGCNVGKMKMILMTSIFIAACLPGISSNVMASEFSCGSSIISTGDRKFDVLRKCGEPANKRVWQEERIARDGDEFFLEAWFDRFPLNLYNRTVILRIRVHRLIRYPAWGSLIRNDQRPSPWLVIPRRQYA
jgi:hypothetical protein